MLAEITTPRRSNFWSRFGRDHGGIASAAPLLFLLAVALSAGLLSGGDPFRTSVHRLLPPSLGHLFGTDDLGRDQFSRVLHGTRTSLEVGLAVSLLSTAIGIAVGALAGYRGGVVDDLLMRITELFQVVPRFLAALVVAAIFGPRLTTIVFILGVTSWTVVARILRAEILSLKRREFVVGATALGASGPRLLLRHVLPNALSPVIVAASLQVGAAILAEAGLAFLGVGDRKVVSWGSMLQSVQPFLRTAPWLAITPGLAITLTVLAVNRLGDALNDALSPHGATRRAAGGRMSTTRR